MAVGRGTVANLKTELLSRADLHKINRREAQTSRFCFQSRRSVYLKRMIRLPKTHDSFAPDASSVCLRCIIRFAGVNNWNATLQQVKWLGFSLLKCGIRVTKVWYSGSRHVAFQKTNHRDKKRTEKQCLSVRANLKLNLK